VNRAQIVAGLASGVIGCAYIVHVAGWGAYGVLFGLAVTTHVVVALLRTP
jgi:hypothetical protein